MKLNLGSGKMNLPGYINIDVVKQTEDTVVADVLNLDYEDSSIEEIYSEHMVEHFDRAELDRFFSESRRMLINGGKFVIIAPSIITAINKYNKTEMDINYLDEFLFALHLHEYDYHKQSIYKEKLEMLCDKYDFEIESIRYQDRDVSSSEIVLEAYLKVRRNQ